MSRSVSINRVLMGGFICTGVILFAAGCELSALPEATPTVQTPQITLSPTTEPPTHTPSVTSSAPPRLATATFTPTPSEPTLTPTATSTPGPLAYVIQPGDTYYYIVQLPQIGYVSAAQINANIPEFLRLNPGVRSIDNLPSPGSTIYIPLPPPTPTPEGFDLTQTAQPESAQAIASGVMVTMQVPVLENDSILRFAQEYNTTLSVLSDLNPQVSFFGCDFANPSGGPDCTVFLVVGESVNVPAPTPTPTLSPTPSGNETATPTPTHQAPPLIFPPQNASAPARTFQLQWVGVGVLQPDEVYFVEVQDMTANTTFQDITRGTYYDLPDSLIPADGQPHNMQWRVSIARRTPDGTYVIVGADGTWRAFSWQSR